MVKMPQRQRHNTGGGAGGAELPLLDPGILEAQNRLNELKPRCCVPLASGCLKGYEPVSDDSPMKGVRVICNNDSCTAGTLMHRECFLIWEQHVLNYLRSCGRARSWSEKQRLQNLWTKKGYDLAYRACSCLCGRGHLRKDLNYNCSNNTNNNNNNNNINNEEDSKNKKKRKNKQNCKPSLVTSGSSSANQPCPRYRTNSSSSSGSSPPSDSSLSPNRLGSKRWGKEMALERSRHGSGGIGMFARRLDYSSFKKALPRTKLNAYHIKVEDDSQLGNDETKCFILSTLASQRTTRIACVLCHQALLVFERYPLIDGTFFLTPLRHSCSAIPVQVDGKAQYLTAVCMGCLEGWSVILRCCYCRSRWNGSSLILGTMYTFDIFAAMPCCEERLKCSRCRTTVISTGQKLPFFSEYSRAQLCPSCGHLDYHFVKPLSSYMIEEHSCGRW